MQQSRLWFSQRRLKGWGLMRILGPQSIGLVCDCHRSFLLRIISWRTKWIYENKVEALMALIGKMPHSAIYMLSLHCFYKHINCPQRTGEIIWETYLFWHWLNTCLACPESGNIWKSYQTCWISTSKFHHWGFYTVPSFLLTDIKKMYWIAFW